MFNIKTCFTGFLALLLVAISTPLYNPGSSLSAQTPAQPVLRSYIGRISEPTAPNCLQSSLQLVDCDNRLVAHLQTPVGGPDLTRFLDRYVQIIGNEVSGTCPVLVVNALREISPLDCNLEPTDPDELPPPELRIGFEGVLQRFEGFSICMQGEYELRDCANGRIVMVTPASGLDLNPLVGQYVRITGRDVGVECRVIEASEVTVMADACISPQPQGVNRREGILVYNETGGYELRDCDNNLLLELIMGARRPSIESLNAFVGQYVRVKGKRVKGNRSRFEVRRIVVKTNRCNR